MKELDSNKGKGEGKFFNIFAPTLRGITNALAGHAFDFHPGHFLLVDKEAEKYNYPEDRLADIEKERRKLSELAKAVLDPALFEEYSQVLDREDYDRIWQTIVDYYLLTIPCLDPDQNKQILEAERRTQQQHIGRSEEGQRVWVAKETSPLAYQRLSVRDLDEQTQSDVELWFKQYGGLLDHIFVAAAPLMIELIKNIQVNIKELLKKNGSISDLQQKFLKVDPYLYAIKMLFHDDGRKLSQHRIAHEQETQNVLSMAGVNKSFREEPPHPAINKEFPLFFGAQDTAEENFMQAIFYFTDCVAKFKPENGQLRRPVDFLKIFTSQSQRYAGESNKVDRYAEFEKNFFNRLLLWLEDPQVGLGFPREELTKVFEKVEEGASALREELSLVDPRD